VVLLRRIERKLPIRPLLCVEGIPDLIGQPVPSVLQGPPEVQHILRPLRASGGQGIGRTSESHVVLIGDLLPSSRFIPALQMGDVQHLSVLAGVVDEIHRQPVRHQTSVYSRDRLL